jgi:hypothetical protein
MKSGGFKRYDFGDLMNLEKYGQITPPSYNLAALENFPIALLHGSKDVLADTLDVDHLAFELPKSSLIFKKEYLMGHMTF